MKTLSVVCNVELTKDEVITITDALDTLYEFNETAYEDALADGRKDDEKYYFSLCEKYLPLRNSLANLIGRTFED